MPSRVLYTLCAGSYLFSATLLCNKLRINLPNVVELLSRGGKIRTELYLPSEFLLLVTVVCSW